MLRYNTVSACDGSCIEIDGELICPNCGDSPFTTLPWDRPSQTFLEGITNYMAFYVPSLLIITTILSCILTLIIYLNFKRKKNDKPLKHSLQKSWYRWLIIFVVAIICLICNYSYLYYNHVSITIHDNGLLYSY